MPAILIKRVYDLSAKEDGTRFLIDGLWPRGIKKEALQMEGWFKEIAPSAGLRRWFGHDPAKWEEFQKRYRAELGKHPEACQTLLEAAQRGTITLLYSARDTDHNNAKALQSYLEERLKRK